MTAGVESSGPAPGASVPLLELSGITKRFGAVTANDDISLSVAPGEVVALLGENGAGKSTLMKVVYGLNRPDEGTIRIAGTELDIGSPRDAMAAGIGMVTQEFSLVETMTVSENVALAGVGLGPVRVSAVRARVVATMERVGVSLDPDRLVFTLSIGERQAVEIVKALFSDCRVLILDEPTAVLPPADVRALFATVTRLSTAGLGVLFVSHKLREVAEISHRVVVLRRGKLVADQATSHMQPDELARLMMGSGTSAAVAEPAVAHPETPMPRARAPRGDPLLEIRGLTVSRNGRDLLAGIDLDVHASEIVGVAGISGNGQTDLLDALSGVVVPTSGSVVLDGFDLTRADVPTRLRAGLGRLTEDRRGSVIAPMSVEHTLVLEDLPAYSRRGLLDRKSIRAYAETMIERFDIKARPTDVLGTLSGGNVQKVLLARALARNPRVLVVAQPTRGLDVGAYRYVHAQLAGLRSAGAGVLLISEDLDELHALCDRITVLFRGAIMGDLPVNEATTERLGVLMTGDPVHA